MEYSLEQRDDAVVVRVDGRVDEATWEAFGAGLQEAIAQSRQSSVVNVIIDLSELDYMSSRGLRVLTVAKRQGDEAGVALILASPNDVMSEILAISRYDKLFTITGSIDLKQ